MTTAVTTAPLQRPRLARQRLQNAAVEVRPIIRTLFVLFVLSMPIETAKLPGMPPNLTFAKIFGYLFFLVALTQMRVTFRRPRFAVVLFWIYTAAITVLIVLRPAPGAIGVLLQTIQWMVLLWVASNLLAFRSVRSATLLALTIGCTLLAGLQAFAPVTNDSLSGDRITALGENPNTAGAMFAIGIIAALGWRREYSHGRPLVRNFLMACAALMGAQMVRTGSRGAMLALVLGLLVYVLVAERFAGKVKAAIVAFIVLAVLGWIVLTTENVRTRWQRALEQRDLSHREMIFPVAWQMFTERPLTGWGVNHHFTELGWRFGREALEEHNLVLYILNEGGLFAGLPYMLGLFVVFLLGFRARRAGAGIAALALFVTLMVVNLSNVFHYRKTQWVLLAFAIGSAPRVIRRVSQRPLPPPPRPA
ncbi:MAG TPA: O-antigen ligase family protein [Thermoanaerobaculia bacterium]|nr:O-antigen ligase family protein [Thermoanaerobaculia bacterium]